MGCYYPAGTSENSSPTGLTPIQPVRSTLHVYTRLIMSGHSYATGCKASGMLKAGELTFGETSYIISSSAGKGIRSA
jgi:hypothetical protein